MLPDVEIPVPDHKLYGNSEEFSEVFGGQNVMLGPVKEDPPVADEDHALNLRDQIKQVVCNKDDAG